MENPYSLKKNNHGRFSAKKKKAKAFAIQNTDFFILKKGILLAGTILQIHFNENLLNVFIFRAPGHLYAVCLMSFLK